MPEQFIVAVAFGLFVGLFSGLLGIGGGTLMIPVFRLGFGMSPIASTATSLFTIVPTSLSGCVAHIKNGTCVIKVGLSAGIAGACASPLGVFAATNSPGIAIMACAAVIIAYSALTMFNKALHMPKNKRSGLSVHATLQRFRSEFADEEKSQEETDQERSTREAARVDQKHRFAEERERVTPKTCSKAAAIGLVAGFASGYVGVGGGFLMVPLFVSVLGISMKKASGTSLIAVVLLAIPGVVTQCLYGNVDYLAGIAMAVGSIPGALLGASLIRYIPERKLRFIFAFFLLFAAIILISNELGIFGR